MVHGLSLIHIFSAEASAAVSAAVEPQPASIALHMAAASKTLMDFFIIVPPFQKKNAFPGRNVFCRKTSVFVTCLYYTPICRKVRKNFTKN